MFVKCEKSDIALMLCLIFIWSVPMTIIGILIIINSLTKGATIIGYIFIVLALVILILAFLITHSRTGLANQSANQNININNIINIPRNPGNAGITFQSPQYKSAAC